MAHGFVPGRLYRRKTIADAGPFETVAAMEDDFHHFTVRVRHDGSHVTEVTGEAVRFPWTTCPGAIAKLDELIGTPLFPTLDKRLQLRLVETRHFNAVVMLRYVVE